MDLLAASVSVSRYLSIALLLCWSTGISASKQSLEGMAVDDVKNAQQTHKLEREWSVEERQQRSEIERLESVLKGLKFQLNKVEQSIATERRRIAEQQRRLVETQKIRDGLQAWLQAVFKRLKQSVDTGLPFLKKERQRRLADLGLVLNDPYTPVYEQFRRVFEALLVEAEYGHGGEAYRAEIDLDGEQTQVDLLRIGRLALFYRTLDQQSVGVYDPAQQHFVALDSDTMAGISQAFKMVRREVAADLVTLPVGRIEP